MNTEIKNNKVKLILTLKAGSRVKNFLLRFFIPYFTVVTLYKAAVACIYWPLKRSEGRRFEPEPAPLFGIFMQKLRIYITFAIYHELRAKLFYVVCGFQFALGLRRYYS